MEDLFSQIPIIKRARGYRLYAFSGKRYLDLWLSDGHNFLGHKPQGFVNYLKQAAERGAIADLPSLYTRRFVNALRSHFPDCQSFLIAPTLPALMKSASRALGRTLSCGDIFDPLVPGEGTPGPISVWRPFCADNIDSDLVLPIVPTGFGPVLFALCSRQPLPEVDFPPASALILAGAAQRLGSLKDLALPEWYAPDLFAAAPHFTQHGLYLVPRGPAAAYPALFRRFLEAGLVLSPRPGEPSILPLELSPGELKLLLKIFRGD
ncbi:MAG: hypothetical protein JXD23_06745 [Spirochaetales bacterium]|nr:hypothetical protein [Spirochaetales bacterium]